MAPPAVDDLLRRLRERWDDLPQAELELAERVARDLVRLQARELVGQGEPLELAHARAAAASLSAGAAAAVASTIEEWLTSLAGELLERVLPGA